MKDGAAIAIELMPSTTVEVRALIAELEEILSAEYPPEQRHGLRLEALFQPHIRFFVARFDGVAVGCGGVALFDDFAEVKRNVPARGSARARRGGSVARAAGRRGASGRARRLAV